MAGGRSRFTLAMVMAWSARSKLTVVVSPTRSGALGGRR
jgi:hypothetical protein